MERRPTPMVLVIDSTVRVLHRILAHQSGDQIILQIKQAFLPLRFVFVQQPCRHLGVDNSEKYLLGSLIYVGCSRLLWRAQLVPVCVYYSGALINNQRRYSCNTRYHAYMCAKVQLAYVAIRGKYWPPFLNTWQP